MKRGAVPALAIGAAIVSALLFLQGCGGGGTGGAGSRPGVNVSRESVATGGGQASGGALAFGNSGAVLSGTGRFVAFQSDATDLLGVGGDLNDLSDIFLRDRQAGTTVRVSVADNGAEAGGVNAGIGSEFPSISPDGRFVAFTSDAENLVAGDTNVKLDVFLRDTSPLAPSTTRASVGPGGVEANGDSQSFANAVALDNAGNLLVVFTSEATNLVAGDNNAAADIFVRNVTAGTTARASVGAGGAQADNASLNPGISTNGRHVAFESAASNLVPSDTNARSDVFVRDLVAGTTVRLSVDNAGVQGNGDSFSPAISGDGRFVAFESTASNLVPSDTNAVSDVFLHDRDVSGSGTFDTPGNTSTVRVSVGAGGVQAAGGSFFPAISDDGRFVIFETNAANLDPFGDGNGATDVYAFDRSGGTLKRLSVNFAGAESDRGSFQATVSRGGQVAAYTSDATNLVSGDTNGLPDIFAAPLP